MEPALRFCLKGNLVTLYLLLIQLVNAQPSFTFEKLTMDDGLKNGYVTSIVQDSIGFLWIGTANGLHRYDGYEFKHFGHIEGDPNSLTNYVVWDLEIDSHGRLWIATNHGLNLMDLRTEQITQFLSDPIDSNTISSNQILSLVEDQLGWIWIGTENGLSIYHPDEDIFERRFFSQNPDLGIPSRSVFEDNLGTIWVSHGSSLFQFLHSENRFKKFLLNEEILTPDPQGNVIRALYRDTNEDLWIGTEMNGLIQYHWQTKNFSHFVHNTSVPNSLSHNRITTIIPADDSTLFIGTTEGGLNILNTKMGSFEHFESDPFDPYSLTATEVRDVFIDRVGNLWLGTYYEGLNVVKKYRKPFENYHIIPGKPNWLLSNIQPAFAERVDGKIWVATIGGGIQLFDPSTNQFSIVQTDKLPSENIYDILDSKDDYLWFVWSDGLGRMHVPSGEVESIYPDKTFGDTIDGWLQGIYLIITSRIYGSLHMGDYIFSIQRLTNLVLVN